MTKASFAAGCSKEVAVVDTTMFLRSVVLDLSEVFKLCSLQLTEMWKLFFFIALNF